MGTRADYYLGRGKDAEWLGSTAFDGHSVNPEIQRLVKITDAESWRVAVGRHLQSRDDATIPEQGWPWPWNDSNTTDYAYAFDGGKVLASRFGSPWFDPLQAEPEDDGNDSSQEFPDMSARKNVAYDHRSGAMFIVRQADGSIRVDG